ncbi:hypothetical protein FA13DRAFT_1728965 [Coprinellus micaceus]|uniref:Small ribosomal subunit protein mS35 mitochondrial conserved domain-containing protein n=1 Tax=Coprinellus micaceus TaxID=71717 RepID=A0A4Y7TMH4_COPMI|nr:hypothetical protein FA13DRAFT_1728965 [Coprinellus micaceus]
MSSSSSLLSLARRSCLSPSSSSSSAAAVPRTFVRPSEASALAPPPSPVPPAARKPVMEENMTEDDMFALLTEPAGHHLLMQKRMMLRYLRVIEHEMPKLVAYRKPFVPPSSASTPLYVKYAYYFGEPHPAEAKRSLVVAVDDLPLTSPSSVHKLKLLAGPSGVNSEEAWGNGYVKISSDTFASAAMNLKWVSDALGRLVESANVRKGKKGDHLRNRPLQRVSLRDFPREWLPPAPGPCWWFGAGAKDGVVGTAPAGQS